MPQLIVLDDECQISEIKTFLESWGYKITSDDQEGANLQIACRKPQQERSGIQYVDLSAERLEDVSASGESPCITLDRAVMDVYADRVAILDRDFRILELNRAAARGLNSNADDLIGQYVFDLFPPGVALNRRKRMEKVLENARPIRFQDERNGIYFDNIVQPLFDNTGKVQMMLVAARDITERKQIDDMLREKQALLQSTIESLPFGFFALDLDDNYIIQNSICKNHWGDLVGRNIKKLPMDEGTQKLWLANNTRARSGEFVTGEVEYTFNGQIGHYYNVIAPIQSGDEILGVIGVNIDITAQKQAEAELRKMNLELEGRVNERTQELQQANESLRREIFQREKAEGALEASHRRYRSLFENSLDPVFFTSIDGRVLECNKAALDCLGYSPEDLPTLDLRNIYTDPADRQRIIDEMLAYGAVKDYEVSLRRKDGKDIWCRVSAVTCRDVDGNMQGLEGFFRDVSVQKKNEALRNEFFANISHEFKTPLTSIRGYAETLLDGPFNIDSKARDFIKTIFENSIRLQSLTEQILWLAQLEEGALKMDIQPINIKGLIQSSVKTLTPKAVEKGVRLEVCCPSNLPSCKGDFFYLERVLENLIDNAIRYGNPQSTVSIRAKISKEYLTISVTDRGQGIAGRDQKRIFDRFFRVESSRTRKVGGTGLGLSIVKHIIEAHGGHVCLSSKLGKGSTFSFSLPL